MYTTFQTNFNFLFKINNFKSGKECCTGNKMEDEAGGDEG